MADILISDRIKDHYIRLHQHFGDESRNFCTIFLHFCDKYFEMILTTSSTGLKIFAQQLNIKLLRQVFGQLRKKSNAVTQ